jgi:hypothetical protein
MGRIVIAKADRGKPGALSKAIERARQRSERYQVTGAGKVPTAEGFYWALWRIKAEGTADESEPPGQEWEVMHVVENCLEETDPEFLMVMVPGVEKWQALENFIWGDEVLPPQGILR